MGHVSVKILSLLHLCKVQFTSENRLAQVHLPDPGLGRAPRDGSWGRSWRLPSYAGYTGRLHQLLALFDTALFKKMNILFE